MYLDHNYYYAFMRLDGKRSLTSLKARLRDDWAAEILLGLRAVLFKLSVWDHDASYGAALQGLRYIDARHKGVVPRTPSRWQKGFYGLFTVGGRYAWEKWEGWLVEREGGEEEVITLLAICYWCC